MLQPPPEPLQPVSDEKVLPLKWRVVPPTEMTLGDEDGYSAGVPLSPDETKKLTPEWEKWLSYPFSPLNSELPQLLETYPAWFTFWKQPLAVVQAGRP